MTPQNARKALALLRPIGQNINALSNLPGLAPTDVTLLQQLAGSAVLLARRMDILAQGAQIAGTLDELRDAVALACVPTSTSVRQ